MGEDIYRGRTAFSGPLTGRNREGEGDV